MANVLAVVRYKKSVRIPAKIMEFYAMCAVGNPTLSILLYLTTLPRVPVPALSLVKKQIPFVEFAGSS
jgi:hypothetical protein